MKIRICVTVEIDRSRFQHCVELAKQHGHGGKTDRELVKALLKSAVLDTAFQAHERGERR